MSVQHFPTSHRGLTLSLLAFAAGIGLWTSIGAVPDLPATLDIFASAVAQCQDSADVMASLDRSRNGISLTCNSDTLAESAAR